MQEGASGQAAGDGARSDGARRARPAAWAVAACAAGACAPAVAVAALIGRFGLNVPYLDDWYLGDVIIRAHERGLRFADLFAQHNEHRPLVVRAVALGSAALTGWTWVLLMWLSLAAVAATVGLLWRVAREEIGGREATWAGVVAGVFALSMGQYRSWTWAFPLALFLMMFFGAAAVWGVRSDALRPRAKVWWAAAMAAAATYCEAGGMALWVLLPLVLWTQPGVRRRAMAGTWAAAAAVVIGTYFLGFHWPAATKPGDVVGNLGTAPWRWLEALGMAAGWVFVARQAAPVSLGAGAAMVAVWAGAVGYVAWRRDPALWRRAAPWLAVAGFSMLSAAGQAVLRPTAEQEQEEALRYLTYVVWMPVGVVYLAALVVRDLRERGVRSAGPWGTAAGWVVGAAVAAHAVAGVFVGWRAAERLYWERVRSMGVMELCEVWWEPWWTSALDPFHDKETEPFRPRARALNRLGLLRPPIEQTRDVTAFAGDGGPAYGHLDGAMADPGGYVLRGRAVLPGRRGRGGEADDVIVCAEAPDGRVTAIAVSDWFYQGAWLAPVARVQIPAGTRRLSAWAFDALTGKAHRLAGASEVGAADGAARGGP